MTPAKRQLDRHAAGWTVVVLLFIALALVFIAMKGQVGALSGPVEPPYRQWRDVCGGELRPCLRVGGAAFAYAIEAGMRALVSPLFWGLPRSPLEATTPWSTPDLTPLVRDAVVPYTAYLAYCLLSLSPLLLATRLLYRGNGQRAVFLMAVFGALFGWHPLVATALFALMDLAISWPHSYYLFNNTTVLFYDFFAIAVVVLAVLLAAAPQGRRWWVIAGLTVLGQLTLEHMGFVVGVILAAGALVEPAGSLSERLGRAARRLAVAGLWAVAGALATTAGFYAMGFSTAAENSPEGIGVLFTRWLPTNLAWAKVIVANLVTMVVPALLGGALAGLVAVALGAGEARQARAITLVALGGMAAFTAVFLLGFVFLAYPAEMGRQFLPLALLAAIVGAKGVEWAWVRRRA